VSHEGKPLVIGVNVNENTMRDSSSHVPWTAEEIATVAAASESQGAALMHFHARTPLGDPDHSAAGYAAVVHEVRAVSSLLLAPSMANVAGYDVEGRLSNIAPNQADPSTAADLLPVDMGCANMDLVDPASGEFRSEGAVFVNSVGDQRELLRRARELGMKPYLASFNLSWTRSILAHVQAGRVAEPVVAVFVLGGEEFLAAHPVTPGAIDAHLALIPPGLRLEWMVSAYRGDVLTVAEHAIVNGGHVAVGVGDHHYGHLGRPTTPELVAMGAELGRKHGRPPATPKEARALLGVDDARL